MTRETVVWFHYVNLVVIAYLLAKSIHAWMFLGQWLWIPWLTVLIGSVNYFIRFAPAEPIVRTPR